jgi:hypothetical protein
MGIKKDVKVRDLLPLGSVVTLKNSGNLRIMITEYFVRGSKENVVVDKTDGTCDIFDYQGMDWYEQPDSDMKVVLFNHDLIDRVLFRGYVNEESIALSKKLEQFVSQMD